MMRNRRGMSEPEKDVTGSLNKSEPVYLAIGRLGKPHGLDGSVILYILTDFPERLKKGKNVFIGDEHIPASIWSIQEHPRGFIIKFKEFSQIDQIEKFKTQFVFVDGSELPPLPNGEYYHHELIGLNVFDNIGLKIGILMEVLETGANDVYVIKDENNKEILYPALLSLIEKIDLEQQVMVVKPLEYYNQG